jgi:hypothetical protein
MRRRLLLLALLLGAPAALAAQAVRGSLRAGGTGEPVPGAHMQLRDAAGRVVASANTDAGGGFLLRAPAAGSYTLSAERIGFARAVSPALRLADGRTVDFRLEAAPQGSSLEGIVVRGGGGARCRTMPPAGEPVHQVWTAARRALEGADSAVRAGLYRYTARVFERDMEPRRGTVQRERTATTPGMTGSPFRAAALDRLADGGYVQEDGDSLVFHAPDAGALLSDEFLEHHCFRLQEPPAGGEGLIGLAFEPVRGRGVPDIEGVLWVDRASSDLRRVEYRYTGLESRRAAENAGGELEFRRLPAGGWIVSRWRIRMPMMGVQKVAVAQPRPGTESREQDQWTLLGVRETGGEVVQVARRDGAPVMEALGARLAGTVYDSTRRAPLAGGRVWLTGTEYSTRADSAGRFELADLPEGRYTVSFLDERLDSLGWAPPPVEVTLTPGAVTRRDLAVPPPARLLAAACSAEPAAAAGAGILVGVVRGEGAAPLAGARVTLSGGGRELQARTDARGVYRFCGAPALAPLAVRVETPGAVVRTTLRLEGEPVLQDFTVGPAGALAAAPGRSAGARGTVSGRVLGGPEGRPLAGATVELAGGGRATTDAQGRFTLRGVAAGTRSVSVAHPQHGTRTAEVAVDAGADLELRLGEGMRLAALVTTPYTLDPLRVEARAENRALAATGFYERQKSANGHFLTGEQIRQGSPLSNMMRMVPGVRVIRYSPPPPPGCGQLCGSGPAESRLVPSRGATSGRISMNEDERGMEQCMMPVFLDGVRVASSSPEKGNDIDRISTRGVVAIEVYTNGTEIPARFAAANQGCGVVLMWSGVESESTR